VGTNSMLAIGHAADTNNARYIRPLNLVAQGQDYNSRVGRKILIKSVYVRGTIFPQNAGGLAEPNTVARCLLIWDLQPNNGPIPNLSDIFQQYAAGPTNIFNSSSLMNLNYRERFVVLWDKEYTLGQVTAAIANGESCRVVKKYKKVGLSVTYSGVAALTIGEIATGALHLVVLGDATAGTAAQLTGVARIRFTDA